MRWQCPIEYFCCGDSRGFKKDVLSKRGDERLIYSSNGVDYKHFHDEVIAGLSAGARFPEDSSERPAGYRILWGIGTMV